MKHSALAILCLTVMLGLGPLRAQAASAPTPPQPGAPHDLTHPRIMQEVAQQVASAKPSAAAAAPTAGARFTPRAAQAPTAGGFGSPSREVFGFGLASSLGDPTVGYTTWNFSLLGTVAYFGLHVQDDGTFANDNGWTVWNSGTLTSMVSTAHSNSTKVVLTIIEQDFSSGTPHMCSAISHYPTTIANAVNEMKAKGVDGINVDYEGLNGSCGTTAPNWARDQFTGLVRDLRSAMPAGSYLSVDTYAGAAADPSGFFDVRGLGNYADSFFVMAYDLEYSNYWRAPTNCSSFCLGPTAPLAGYYYSDTSTVSQYLAVVPASKVLLGVPYYGRKACVASATPNQYPTSSVTADTYLDAAGEASSSQVQAGTYTIHRDANDPAGQERWDTWFNTTMNCTRELYWDDTTSLGPKYDLVNSSNLRGVGIWNLNYGGGAAELWQLLAMKFGTSTPWKSLGGYLTSSPDASGWASTRVDTFVRGTDNGLWQRTWDGTSWSSWSSLGGMLTSAPSAVSWGPNRIDVFARGSDNALWHRWWDGTKWWGWESLGGTLTSGPDASSWGANRLDIFGRGGDNGLWHKYWDGTKWSGWEALGGTMTSDPGAVSWGGNRVDVFARGTDNALWHRWWDASIGGGWHGWDRLGGLLYSGPDASSCTSGHLDVFAVGSDYGLYQLGWSGSNWTAWQRLGGYWSADPGAVCPAGGSSVYLFERAPDGSLYQTNVTGS